MPGRVTQDGDVLRFSADETRRWATLRERDARTTRPPSFAVEFSDGRRLAGEMSLYWLHRLCCRWVMEGADADTVE